MDLVSDQFNSWVNLSGWQMGRKSSKSGCTRYESLTHWPRQLSLFVHGDLGSDAIRKLPGNANDFRNCSAISSAITLVLKTNLFQWNDILEHDANFMLAYMHFHLEDIWDKCRKRHAAEASCVEIQKTHRHTHQVSTGFFSSLYRRHTHPPLALQRSFKIQVTLLMPLHKTHKLGPLQCPQRHFRSLSKSSVIFSLLLMNFLVI